MNYLCLVAALADKSPSSASVSEDERQAVQAVQGKGLEHGGTEVRIAPLAMLRVLSGGRLPAGISCPRTRCAFALAS